MAVKTHQNAQTESKSNESPLPQKNVSSVVQPPVAKEIEPAIRVAGRTKKKVRFAQQTREEVEAVPPLSEPPKNKPIVTRSVLKKIKRKESNQPTDATSSV